MGEHRNKKGAAKEKSEVKRESAETKGAFCSSKAEAKSEAYETKG